MKQPDFIQIPTQVLTNPNLQPNDGFAYGYIYWMTKLKNEKCFASNDTLAKLLGCTDRTVQKCLQRLEKEGYIRRKFNNETNQREEIIPLVVYGGGETDFVGGDEMADVGGRNGGHQKKSIKNSNKKYVADATKSEYEELLTGNELELDEDYVQSLPPTEQKKIAKLQKELMRNKSAGGRNIRIILTHAKFKGIDLSDGIKRLRFINRNLKPASELLVYEPQEILIAHKYCSENFGDTWGLEAVVRNIDNAIAQKN